ncbi:hypothetical protein SAMN02745121_01856 [Nannocystis exedens]|uniref:Lipoprotein n=1 Tax=Nannocystis exedens TaxID=54 RepID=A0A1I1VPV7_9BACT|nr:hypothetical protein [Nannocystis exedens]PCC72739.1 hypothetical protein NAEX_05824 [Nannocystis exedens]SFD85132.1 hypothetical protein SAMN02745121_01856 [Nannocystis exedens]
MLQRTWLLGLALAAGVAGCNKSSGICMNANCEASVPVAVVDDGQPGGQLRAGAYTFRVSTDYAEKAWSCTLPADDCALDFFTDFADGEDDGTLSIMARAGETGLEIEVLETRGNIWSGPAKFMVAVERDGEAVVEETFEPRYEEPLVPDACAVCLKRKGRDLVVHVPAE